MNRLAITEITINNKKFISYIALNEKRDFVDFELYASGESLLNNIYIGRVEHVISNIGAVFVQISAARKCFLSMDEAPYQEKADRQNASRLYRSNDKGAR